MKARNSYPTEGGWRPAAADLLPANGAERPKFEASEPGGSILCLCSHFGEVHTLLFCFTQVRTVALSQEEGNGNPATILCSSTLMGHISTSSEHLPFTYDSVITCDKVHQLSRRKQERKMSRKSNDNYNNKNPSRFLSKGLRRV